MTQNLPATYDTVAQMYRDQLTRDIAQAQARIADKAQDLIRRIAAKVDGSEVAGLARSLAEYASELQRDEAKLALLNDLASATERDLARGQNAVRRAISELP